MKPDTIEGPQPRKVLRIPSCERCYHSAIVHFIAAGGGCECMACGCDRFVCDTNHCQTCLGTGTTPPEHGDPWGPCPDCEGSR